MINVICYALIVFGVVLFIRTNVAYRNQTIIGDAVLAYSIDMINRDMFEAIEVRFRDIEPFERTMFRLWDFGYTRLLPPDKFEIIRPYIEEK